MLPGKSSLDGNCYIVFSQPKLNLKTQVFYDVVWIHNMWFIRKFYENIQISHKLAKNFHSVQQRYNVMIQFQNTDSHFKVTLFMVVWFLVNPVRKHDYFTISY